MKITNCKTNHITNPLGFQLESTRVSWQVENTKGQKQIAARILVSDHFFFNKIIFDSGIKEDISSLAYLLPAKLQPCTRYYWTVEVWADNGETAISEVNWFETAKMEEEWQAKWIGCKEIKTENPVFVKEIELDQDTEQARIYACGLGVYEIYINGEKVGNEFLAPGCNNYAEWLQYQTYEAGLKKGKNRIAVSLGNGWYKGKFGLELKENIYGDAFKLLMEMRLFFKDGSTRVFGTDESWKVVQGDVSFNNIYDGEVYAPSPNEKKQYPIEVLDDGYDKLSARLSLPVVVKMELPVKEILHTPAGEIILDMGQNMVGFLRFRCREEKGTNLRLRHGEILQEGNFYGDNLRTAKAEYTYISDGNEREIRPYFTYYGFRYVKLEGFTQEIKKEDFTGCVLFSDLEETGSFLTSDEKVNKLVDNALWGQRGNYVDVPTDCPQRDERMGWTGDTQVFTGTACFHMDSYAFLSKYTYDLYTTQKQLGCVTNVIPAFSETHMASCGWGDAATIIPWTLYQFYGDKVILEQQYESMKLWVQSIYELDEKSGGARLWMEGYHFGDWLGQDNENPSERFKGGTEDEYIATAYYYYSTTLVAKSAGILGKKQDEEFYLQLAEEIKKAIRAEYFTENGRLAICTQTGYVLALFMGFAPKNAVQRLIKELKAKLKINNGYLKTGFIGTAYLCRVLSDHGANEAAYRLLLNEDAPSWLYAVNLGATTIWERWNSLLADGTINGTDMNSFNHYSYGAIVEWMYRNMAGIRPLEEEPGFKKAVIAPQPYYRISTVDAVYRSAAGVYESHWEIRENGMFWMKVVIPFDAQATVLLPSSGQEAKLLGAGTYEFEYAPVEPFLKAYSTLMNLEELAENDKVKLVLDSCFPAWRHIPQAYLNRSPREMSASPALGLSSEDLDKMDELLKHI
jgi:alpha-L-rhamnosidase